MANFGSIVEWVLRLEDRTLAGKTVNLGDGAGLTRFGVTSKNHPELPDAFWTTMSREDALAVAKQVYHEKYWAPIRGTEIESDELAATLMSFAVNDGPKQAVKLLQRCLDATQADGVVGSWTLHAISCLEPAALAERLREAQEGFYQYLAAQHPEKQKNLQGWLNRARARYPDLP
jgi:lysozyme family protein